nr:diguanylate cyclase [uncultured Desulfuromonas sp.]
MRTLPLFPIKSPSITKRWIPYATALLLCLAVYSLWLALEERETKARHQTVRGEAYALLNLIEVDLEQRIRSLQRFVFRWQQRGGMSRDEFLFEAASYLGDHPGYQALEWVDPGFKVRWVVPEKGNEEALGLNLALEQQRRTALKLARHQKVPTLTAPIELVQGGVGFLVYLPIFANDHFDGFLLAVFRTESWIESLLAARHSPVRFLSRISMDKDEIYRSSTWQDSAEPLHEQQQLTIRNHLFRVESRPTAQFLNDSHTPLPQLVLIFGLSLTACLTVIIILFQKAASAVHSVTENKKSLESEIQQRKKIEAERELLLNDIGERIKALHCLYSLSRLAESTGKNVDQFLRESVECLPPAWQFPEYATARIIFDETCYTTSDFQQSPLLLEAAIQINDRRRGVVQICYSESLHHADQEVFSEEERYLINEIADRVGSVVLQKKAAEALAKERQRLAFILEGTHVGTWEWNVQTGETTFNSRWAEHLGYRLEELTPVSIKTWKELTHPEDMKKALRALQRHFSGREQYYECEIRLQHKQGHWVWILDRGKVSVWTEDGAPLLMFGTHMDISAQKQAEARIRHLANHDALTGLPSLRLVRDRINVALENAHRKREQCAILFFDLDGFKAINDQYGHDAGDFVLQTVAGHLLDCVRRTDTVARIGGDEFLLLLTEIKTTRDIETIAAKVVESVDQPMEFEGHRLQVQASVGIAVYPQHGHTAKALIKQADNAMYAVKNSGKNSYAFATDR